MKYEKLISPTRSTNYTVVDALKKFLERRNFNWSWTMGKKYSPQCMFGTEGHYADYDGYIILQAESLPSNWTDSIVSQLYAEIPFHCSNEGKFSFGRYLSWDFDPALYDDPKSRPAYYFEPRRVEVISRVGDTEETLSFEWDVTGKTNQNEQNLIVRILRESLVASVMLDATTATEAEAVLSATGRRETP